MRGSSIQLDPKNPFTLGLSWEQSALNAFNFDLDIVALAFNSEGEVLETCFYGNQLGFGGALIHFDDEKSTQHEMGCETITIDLRKIPSHCNSLTFTMIQPDINLDRVVYETGLLHITDTASQTELMKPISLAPHALRFPAINTPEPTHISSLGVCTRIDQNDPASMWEFRVNMYNIESAVLTGNPMAPTQLSSLQKTLLNLSDVQISLAQVRQPVIQFYKKLNSKRRPNAGELACPFSAVDVKLYWPKALCDLQLASICLDKDGNVVKIIDTANPGMIGNDSAVLNGDINAKTQESKINKKDKSPINKLQHQSIGLNLSKMANINTSSTDSNIDAIYFVATIYDGVPSFKKFSKLCDDLQIGTNQIGPNNSIPPFSFTMSGKNALLEVPQIFYTRTSLHMMDTWASEQGSGRAVLLGALYKDYHTQPQQQQQQPLDNHQSDPQRVSIPTQLPTSSSNAPTPQWLIFSPQINSDSPTPRGTIPELIKLHAIFRNKDQLPTTFIEPTPIKKPKGYKVTLVGGNNLKACDVNGFSDPYCQIIHKGQLIFTTKVDKKTLNPNWKESFQVDCDCFWFKIKVWDKDFIGSDDKMGSVIFGIPSDLSTQPKTFTCQLKIGSQVYGTLTLAVARVD